MGCSEAGTGIFWLTVLVAGHPAACVRKVVGEKCPLPGP